MIKSKKLLKSICVVLALVFTMASASLNAWADDGIDGSSSTSTGVSPMYTNILTTTSGITINGVKATCFATMSAHNRMTLKITMELQKKKSSGYETVQTWTDTAVDTAIAAEHSKTINVLSTYRMKVTFQAGFETATYYRYP